MANPNPEVQNTKEAPKEVDNKFDFGSVFSDEDKELATHDSTRVESREILSRYPSTEPSELDLKQSNESKNGEDIQLLGRLNDAWKSESKAVNPNKTQMERIANAAEALQDFALKDSDKYWNNYLTPRFQEALDGKISQQDFDNEFSDYYREMSALAESLPDIDPEKTKELSLNASNLFHVTRGHRWHDIERAEVDRLREKAVSGKTEDILALVEGQTNLGHQASLRAEQQSNPTDDSLASKYAAEEAAMDTDNLRRFEQLEQKCQSPAELLKLSSAYTDMVDKLNIRANLGSHCDKHDHYFKTATDLTEKNIAVQDRLMTMAKNGELDDKQMVDFKLITATTAGRLLNYDHNRYSTEERTIRDSLRAAADSRAAYADLLLRNKIGDEKYKDLFEPAPLSDEEYERLANPQ
ncbi:MAG: hypothetical protein K2W82_04615 [Candidatus Obscuribacterales bacterium]|nr:hypothetical protein [Candidatus Obscuribacterales bacterium]